MRPRTALYAAVIVFVGGLMLYTLATRRSEGISVIHDRNPIFVRLADGSIRNAFTVHILNKALETRLFELTVEGVPGLDVTLVGDTVASGNPLIVVGPGPDARAACAVDDTFAAAGGLDPADLHHHRFKRRLTGQGRRQFPGAMMSSLPTNAGGGTRRRPRELTGRTVLLCLVAFFAVVAAVNVIMMTAAVTTFSGVETVNSYQAGVTFAREEAAAEAQESRHWRVNSSLRHQANGLTQVELSAQDRAGQPLAGLEATVSLIHPNDRRLDRPVAMQASAPGRFRGAVTPSPGQWDLVIELSRDGERLFRSKERIILR